MLSLNLRMPPLMPAIRLPRNATGCLMMSPDHAGHPGEHVLEHRDELADRVDDGLDRADGLVDQTLVLGLQLLDPLVETLAGLDVLRGQGVDDATPAWRRRRSPAARTRSPISFDASAPTFFRSSGRLLT